MTSSEGKGRAWTLSFENVASTADQGLDATHAKDMWSNPLMKYLSSSDPLMSIPSQVTFSTPQEAMNFCVKRGWDYKFKGYLREVYLDSGDLVSDDADRTPSTNPDGTLNPASERVSRGPDGGLSRRETMVTYKIPPYFDDGGGAVTMHGSHSTKSRMGRDWPSGKGREDKDNWAGYDENFLPAAVKHKIKEEGMKLDYYGRDKAGASHYFRPLRYHGDGVVPQWGPNGGVPKGEGGTESDGSPGYEEGEEIAKDVEGWRSRR